MIPSGSVGCGWTVRAMSATVAPISMARASSLIRLLASGPTICAPRRIFESASATSFTNPSASPVVSARPIAAKGTFPIFTLRPATVAWDSWRPTVAISGSVKIAEGIAR